MTSSSSVSKQGSCFTPTILQICKVQLSWMEIDNIIEDNNIRSTHNRIYVQVHNHLHDHGNAAMLWVFSTGPSSRDSVPQFFYASCVMPHCLISASVWQTQDCSNQQYCQVSHARHVILAIPTIECDTRTQENRDNPALFLDTPRVLRGTLRVLKGTNSYSRVKNNCGVVLCGKWKWRTTAGEGTWMLGTDLGRTWLARWHSTTPSVRAAPRSLGKDTLSRHSMFCGENTTQVIRNILEQWTR